MTDSALDFETAYGVASLTDEMLVEGMAILLSHLGADCPSRTLEGCKRLLEDIYRAMTAGNFSVGSVIPRMY